jgi:flavin-dependent dehydrogenase
LHTSRTISVFTHAHTVSFSGEYNYAIAFQERIKLPEDKMAFYEELAEMYVGDDVSPDFYAWVFPKYDHVGVGTGTVVNRPAIKQYQKGIRERAASKLEGGKVDPVHLFVWCDDVVHTSECDCAVVTAY